MAAGLEGAGKERSFGINIKLPFESSANEFIADDPKLINFKYFFTRKVIFMKETHGYALLPGGFGTMDEAFELLTLMQTGKSPLNPVVMASRSSPICPLVVPMLVRCPCPSCPESFSPQHFTLPLSRRAHE